MTAAGNIAGLIPTMQAAALAGDNAGFATKKGKKSFVKQGVKNIVGLSLIPTTAQLASLV
jgi:hypothetical protein